LPEIDEILDIESSESSPESILASRPQVRQADVFNYDDVPTVRRFALSDKRIRGIMGPFGSGKSSGCLMEIVRRGHMQTPNADGIRRTRWGIVRNSYRQLLDSTVKTVHDWFPPGKFGVWKITEHEYTITAFDGVEITLLFRALDRPEQMSNLLSVEYTGAWLNEAREIPREIFEAIDGRIGRFPPERAEGCTWKGIIMDTNPPDDSSWWYKFFEEERPSNAVLFKQPSGLSPQAENLRNLPKGYYRELAKGKSQQFIDVYVHGKYGYSYTGKPVFEANFNDSTHISATVLDPIPGIPLSLGFDFGLNPTCVIGQYTGKGQLRIIDEYVSDSMGLQQFCLNVLVPALHAVYPGYQVLGGGGDPSGKSRSPTDEQTCYQILRMKDINIRNIQPAKTNAYVPRFGAVDHFLTRMVGGEPGLIISPACRYLRKGFNGAYQRKSLGHGLFSDEPDKNIVSHPMEALQYLCMWLLSRKDTDDRYKTYEDYMKQQNRNMMKAVPTGGY
jgi:hypothetical protein